MTTYTYMDFQIPMLPPSVNHYVTHGIETDRGTGQKYVGHRKSKAAKKFSDDFKSVLPASIRDAYVIGERFAVEFQYFIPPFGKGDVDNYNKCLLDAIAACGMLRDRKGKQLSDAWVKRMVVDICDSEEDRKLGPLVVITIRSMEKRNA